MVSFFTVLLYGTATWLAYGLYLLAKRSLRRIGRRYPPGPPGLPLLGNLKLPSELSWKVYRTWGEKYGMCDARVRRFTFTLVLTVVDLYQDPTFCTSMHSETTL